MMSHPVWVRGLKPFSPDVVALVASSHPVWVRGLKLVSNCSNVSFSPSHPVWVRGLKPEIVANELAQMRVAPCVGAWIETKMYIQSLGDTKGRTLCGCVD